MGSGWACGAGGVGSGVAGLADEARRAASRGRGQGRGGLEVLEEWAPGSQGWLTRPNVGNDSDASFGNNDSHDMQHGEFGLSICFLTDQS